MDIRKESEIEGGEEVYSKAVRAGRRTYFFDVKATRNDDYFLTITESRKKQNKDGSFVYDKHKLYLYKEDFAKFSEGLEEVISYIKANKPEFFTEDGTVINGVVKVMGETVSVDEEFESL